MKSLPWLRIACSLVCGGLAFCFLWHAPWLRPRAVIENCLDDEFEFSPDSQRFIVWFGHKLHLASPAHPNEPGVRIHDVATGGKLCTLDKSDEVSSDRIIFSPDSRFAAGSAGKQVTVWDMATGEQTLQNTWIFGVGVLPQYFFSPDGDILFDTTGDEIGGITIRLRDGKTVADFRRVIGDAQWLAPDSGSVAICGTDRELRVIDRFTGKILRMFPLPADGAWNSFQLWSDGRIVTAYKGGPGGERFIWTAPEQAPTLCKSLDFAKAHSISPDGQWLAYTEPVMECTWIERIFDKWFHMPLPRDSLHIVRLEGGEKLASIPNGFHSRFSPDGRTLAVSFADGRIELWDFPLRKPTLLIVLLSVLVGVSVYVGSRWWQKRWREARPATVAPSGLRPVGTADNSPAR